jgi:hypothetical protein
MNMLLQIFKVLIKYQLSKNIINLITKNWKLKRLEYINKTKIMILSMIRMIP